eukprot:TRINITY_DN507_c0_g1_i1.p1 TRINITY_DN507_c0_g1~~TRINITY_DN507_c0_g1_i1.p1  ORF type:complete len:364 (-),score=162.03 TRINITY_DN507_c0_g1_i1:51-1142(-)
MSDEVDKDGFLLLKKVKEGKSKKDGKKEERRGSKPVSPQLLDEGKERKGSLSGKDEVSSPKLKEKAASGKWSLIYVTLMGGSLHWYKKEEDVKPRRSIEHSTYQLLDKDASNTAGSTKKLVITLKSKTEELMFACDDEADYNSWLEKMREQRGKDPRPPLKKEKKMSRAQELAFKMKKNTAGAVANSALGKKMIRDNAPDEVKEMVATLKKMIEHESKSTKKANEIEDNIYKFGVKVYFLVDSGKLKSDDLLKADEPIRKAFEVFVKCHDHVKYSPKLNETLLTERLEEISKLASEATQILTNVLTPLLKAKNIQIITDTVSYIASTERMKRIFLEKSLLDDVSEVSAAANRYTQFHFYANEK